MKTDPQAPLGYQGVKIHPALTRLTLDVRKDPASRAGACARIGEQLGVNAETLKGWVTQKEVDEGQRPGTTTTDAEKLDKLEREVKELRRANAMAVSRGQRNGPVIMRVR